jgi:dolichyl-phosphate-mannose--protein O-mannosyl transferase
MEMFLLAGFLTEFLPWVLVPRTTFIYHYFASVPFFIMAIVLWIREWEERPFPSEPNLFLQAIIALAAVLAVSILISPLLALVVAVLLVAAIILHRQRESASLVKKDLTHLYLAAVLGLFILFYPVLSGLPVPKWYADWLKWLPSWFVNY